MSMPSSIRSTSSAALTTNLTEPPGSDNTPQNAVRVADLFTQLVSRVLSDKLVSELSANKVSLAQLQAMRYIWLHSDVLVGDLADGLSISYPSATNMLKRLERRGLIVRTVNPRDHREVQVSLTEAGTDLVQRVERERSSRLHATLAAMPQAEQDALLDGLQAFLKAAASLGDIVEDICLQCGRLACRSCPLCEERVRRGTCPGYCNARPVP